MKNIRYTLIALFVILLCSCEDFLESKQNDKMIPKTIENYSELIYGEVINKKGEKFMISNIALSDDFSEVVVKFSSYDSRKDLISYYTWAQNLEQKIDGSVDEDKSWSILYHKVLMCNVVINEIDKLDLTDVEDNVNRNILKAECLFLRANAYFRLLNLYGEPFIDDAQARTGLGVPINNAVGVSDKIYKRSSIKEVYNKIEDDLLQSIDLFDKNRRKFPTIFRPDIDASRLLLSRVYLYQKKYNETEKICNTLISTSSKTICNLIEYKEQCFFTNSNTGIIFTYEDIEYKSTSNTGSTFYGASDELLKLYANEDTRPTKFFMKDKRTVPYKYNSFKSNIYGRNFRIEEAYLNRAEARAYIDYTKALEDINKIRKNRLVDNYEVSANTKEDAINLVRNERRMELCFEDHRWFDLRRQGMPEIKHKLTTNTETKIYILEKNSPSYTLSIPFKILESNNIIKNIKRINPKVE